MSIQGNGYTPNFGLFGMGKVRCTGYFKVAYDAIAFANRLSVLTGREECYANTDLPIIDDQQQYDPDDLSPAFSSPYDCNGFRLLTEAEWEACI